MKKFMHKLCLEGRKGFYEEGEKRKCIPGRQSIQRHQWRWNMVSEK